jgi:hypothetical protein
LRLLTKVILIDKPMAGEINHDTKEGLLKRIRHKNAFPNIVSAVAAIG